MKTVHTLTLLAAALCVVTLQAQDPPDLMRQEVLRRGNMVERINGTQAEDPVAYAAAALAVPADDSHKWYISVITTQGCTACERLKRDFAQSDALAGWVNVEQPEHSWAHYNVYSWDDETQKFRFRSMKVRGFPTLLLQPPRNRAWGDPRTIVFQKTGYDGDAARLNREMSDAIKLYCRKLQEKNYVPPAFELSTEQLEQIKAHGAKQGPQQATSGTPGIWHAVQAAYSLGAAAGQQEAATRPIPGGARQPPDLGQLIEGPPPFLVNPDQKRPDPTVPLPDIPPAVDPDQRKPKPDAVSPEDDGEPATMDDLLRAIPGADLEFIRQAVAAGQSVQQAKQVYEEAQAATRLWAIIGGSVVLGLVVLAVFCTVLLGGMWLIARSMRPRPQRTSQSATPAPSPIAYAAPVPTPRPQPTPGPTMQVTQAPPPAAANPPAGGLQ